MARERLAVGDDLRDLARQLRIRRVLLRCRERLVVLRRHELGHGPEHRYRERGRDADLDPRQRAARPADDLDRPLELLQRRGSELGGEGPDVLLERGAVGAPCEVRGDHPRLELRQLAVEAERDLRPHPVADERTMDHAHGASDDRLRRELDDNRRSYPAAGWPTTSSGFMTSAKWQATGCAPPARGLSSGSSSSQIGCAFQQRVRNRHPDGGFAGLGTSPCRTMRCRLPLRFGDSIGTADRRACVYGCIGASYSCWRVPSSTIRPRYMTATRSEMWRTTDRSCAM